MHATPTVDAYLERIGLTERPSIDLDGLALLQRAHLGAVPFENLDVFQRTGVRTDTEWSLSKIITRGRGGWCFENNGAFGWLLGNLGFTYRYIGAYVLLDPADTDNMSHLCLIVDLDQPHLVDVGFGDSFTRPLPIDGATVVENHATYRVRFDEPWFTLVEVSPTVIELDQSERPLYRFEMTTRTLAEFDEQSDRLQAGSGFTEKPFATRLLDNSTNRVTLLKDRIKFRTDGTWTEEPVSDEQWESAYRQWFAQVVDRPT